MLNKNYILNEESLNKFNNIKNSAAYKSYLLGIKDTPIFSKLAQDYINNLDISVDISRILKENKNNHNALSVLFKQYLTELSVKLCAESIMLNEIAETSLDEVNDDINNLFKVKYLMGKADAETYNKAKKIICEKNKTDGLLYAGYLEYMKNNNKNGDLENITSDDNDDKIPHINKTNDTNEMVIEL